jgi:hypothetical protein
VWLCLNSSLCDKTLLSGGPGCHDRGPPFFLPGFFMDRFNAALDDYVP